MPVTFTCAVCGTQTDDIADDLAGKRIKCRECDAVAKVPFPLDYQKPPKEPKPEPTTTTPEEEQSGPVASGRRGVLIGAVAGSLLTAAAAAGLFFLFRPQPADSQQAKAAPSAVQTQRQPRQQPATRPIPQPAAQPVVAQSPIPDQAAQAAEAERQRREALLHEAMRRDQELRELEQDLAEKVRYMQRMHPLQQRHADIVAKKINQNQDLDRGDHVLVIRHWFLFDTKERYRFIVKMAEKEGFKEFCTNIGLRPGDAYHALAIEYYLLDYNGGAVPGSDIALRTSRDYKGKTLFLPRTAAGEQFINWMTSHRDLFAPLLQTYGL